MIPGLRTTVTAALGAAAVATLFFGGAIGHRTGSSRASAGALPIPLLGASPAPGAGMDSVVFSGGCFWGVQAVFEHVNGVVAATSGYAGGESGTAHYGQVGSGTTGHAESVLVVFDPSVVPFGRLLQVFFSVAHDPTELNRQGPDVGPQYRSAIWFTSEGQARLARAYILQLEQAKTFSRPIVTKVDPLAGFYPAEDYHQDYLIHHPHQPYIVINDLPKLEALKNELPELWREQPVRWHARTADRQESSRG